MFCAVRTVEHIRTNYPNTSVKQYMQDIGIDIGNAQQTLCSGNITDRTTALLAAAVIAVSVPVRKKQIY